MHKAARGDIKAIRELDRQMQQYGLTLVPEPEDAHYDYAAEVRAKIEAIAARLEANKGADWNNNENE